MSSIRMTIGGATVDVDALGETHTAGGFAVHPTWAMDDLLSATVAALRAAGDPRAEQVQGCLGMPAEDTAPTPQQPAFLSAGLLVAAASLEGVHQVRYVDPAGQSPEGRPRVTLTLDAVDQ